MPANSGSLRLDRLVIGWMSVYQSVNDHMEPITRIALAKQNMLARRVHPAGASEEFQLNTVRIRSKSWLTSLHCANSRL